MSANEKPSISELRESAVALLSDLGRQRLRAGDPDYVGRALTYLAADPYFHGTGYCKSALVRYLKLIEFTPSQQARIHHLVLKVIDEYGPYSGRHICRLAASVQSPEFADKIRQRLESSAPDVCRRAQFLLRYLKRFNQGSNTSADGC